jgi:menaquinone-dependent protoporphyrinogen oxidase
VSFAGSGTWPSAAPDHRSIDQAERLGVRGHTVFGGRVPAQPHGPLERSMVKNTPEQYRDRRDWDEIRVWARPIASELHTLAPAA